MGGGGAGLISAERTVESPDISSQLLSSVKQGHEYDSTTVELCPTQNHQESRLMKDGGTESKYETSGRIPRIFINLPHFDRYSQQKTKKTKSSLVVGILRDFKQLL